MKKKSKKKESDLIYHLFNLKTSYEKIFEILDNVFACVPFTLKNTDLNDRYTSLVEATEIYLKKYGSKSLIQKAPRIPNNLLGKEIERLGREWRSGSRIKAYRFLGDIEEVMVNLNNKSYVSLSKYVIGTKEHFSDLKDLIMEFRNENGLEKDEKADLSTEAEKNQGNLSTFKTLKSIHLITESLEPTKVIFLVLNQLFDRPIRCTVKNNKGGDTYMKKLYNISYIANAPGKRVEYSKNLADNINNGLFRKKEIADYMRTNKLKKPTLVRKSENDDILVLKGEVLLKTELIKNIPLQCRYLYVDKTN